MFGGFDGEFYNDLNILHLQQAEKTQISVAPSTLLKDYASLVDIQTFRHPADITFVLDRAQTVLAVGEETTNLEVHANKSMILYRLIEKEV